MPSIAGYESLGELPEVPEPMTVNTGDQPVLYRAAEEFFDALLNYLGYEDRGRLAFVELRCMSLAYVNDQRPSDEELMMLIVHDTVAATVLFTRTAYNFCYACFAHYLTPKTVKKMRDPYDEEGRERWLDRG